MARNGSGTYVLPAGQPVVTNTTISSSTFNTLTNDLANALTTSICTDGQTPMQANLPMGSHKLTGLSDGSAGTDSTAYHQLTDAVSTINTSITDAVSTINTSILGVPGVNFITNGDMLIAQLASTYALTTTPTYGSIDNWQVSQSTTAAGIFNQVSANGLGASAAAFAKLGRNAGATSAGNIIMCQALESNSSVPMQGRDIILSFVAKAGANFSASGNILNVVVKSGTGTDQSCASMLSGTWTGTNSFINATQAITTTSTKYSFTGTVPSNSSQVGVQIYYTPSGTAGADDNLYITNVKLEIAKTGQTTGSDFVPKSQQESLAACQRYFWKLSGASGESLATGGFISTSRGAFIVQNPVTMRIAPAVNATGSVAGFDLSDGIAANTVGTAAGALGASNVNYSNFTITGTGTPYTTGRVAYIQANATAYAITFSAQL